MKRLLPLFVCSGVLACGAELATVRTVYLMPMNRGLDQYLANRLTNEHLFQVVTDPKLADGIFTDRLGEGFQMQLELISPTPKPKAEEGKEPPKDTKDAKGAKDAKDEKKPKPAANEAPASPTAASALAGSTENKVDNPAMSSSWGRGKGTIFLVDAKTRQVVWSTFDPARTGADNHTLDRTASDIVSRIKKALNPKKK